MGTFGAQSSEAQMRSMRAKTTRERLGQAGSVLHRRGWHRDGRAVHFDLNLRHEVAHGGKRQIFQRGGQQGLARGIVRRELQKARTGQEGAALGLKATEAAHR